MSGKDFANLVVLGGSYSGLSVTQRLLKSTIKELRTTSSSPQYRIVLVSPSTHFYWNVAAPGVLSDPERIPLDHIFLDLRTEFGKHATNQFLFIQGEAVGINTVHRTVKVKHIETRLDSPHENTSFQNMTYHALIIATGTSTHCDLLGLHGPHENTIEALNKFHGRLKDASSLVIVGGGPSGVECAGQIATWVNRKRRIKSQAPKDQRGETGATEKDQPRNVEELKITLISGHQHVLPKLGPEIGKKAEKQLQQLGVSIINKVRLVTAQQLPNRVTRCVLSNQLILTCDILIAATGVTRNTSFLPEDMLDGSSHVAVDPRFLRATRAGERVYAIGSCCSLEKNTLEDIFRAVPVLTHNMRNDLWEFEIKSHNPFGDNDRRLEALKDMNYNDKTSMTQICPITKWGGVGVFHGIRLPSILVWALKGRDYQVHQAEKIIR
jgi:apoptosis-inducing factor 2